MSKRAPYVVGLDELVAIDEALAGDAIPEAKLADHFRAEAARLRRDADTAETAKIRATLMEAAEWLDKVAVAWASC